MDIQAVLALLEEMDASGLPLDDGSSSENELDSSDIDALSSEEEELLDGDLLGDGVSSDGASSRAATNIRYIRIFFDILELIFV